VRHGSRDGDEKHRRDCGADCSVSWKIKSGRQNGDRYLCTTCADKANQESDKERNRGELADDQEIARP
jgi:hypothetical protein